MQINRCMGENILSHPVRDALYEYGVVINSRRWSTPVVRGEASRKRDREGWRDEGSKRKTKRGKKRRPEVDGGNDGGCVDVVSEHLWLPKKVGASNHRHHR